MSEVLTTSSGMMTSLGIDVGSGALVGFPIGYAAKKLFKVVLVIIGAQMAFLKWLETKGVITVDWSAFSNTAAGSTQAATSSMDTFISGFLGSLGLTGGFAAGALIGWKKG